MKSALPIIVAACVAQLLGRTAYAGYQLTPVSRVFAPSGSQGTQAFELMNRGPNRVALTISFATIVQDEAHVETNHDADDDFLAYPAQMVIAPGGRQTVRVTWLGPASPTHELAYRIIVTEVPIQTLDHSAAPESPSGEVRVFLNYRGTIFIRPPNAAPSVALDKGALGPGNTLAITLVNSGTAIGRIQNCIVNVVSASGGPEIVLPAAMLAALHHTRILAGTRRRYLFPWPSQLAVGPVRVSGRCSLEQ